MLSLLPQLSSTANHCENLIQGGVVYSRTRLFLGAAGVLFMIGLGSLASAQDGKKPAPEAKKEVAPKPAQGAKKTAPEVEKDVVTA